MRRYINCRAVKASTTLEVQLRQDRGMKNDLGMDESVFQKIR